MILDFGLITELSPDTLGGAEHVVGGTPAYVSPEESFGEPPSEAGDWYSVGATIYEALDREDPVHEVPRSRCSSARGNAIHRLLRNCVPEVPADLSSICMGLMCRDPARRLSGHDALRGLDYGAVVTSVSDGVREPPTETPFVGRTRELDVLDEAYSTVTRGRAAAVYVSGPSGIGKSALVRSFLARVKTRDDVVVLSGRCYEHESVPYKALDGVVDSLSRYLMSLSQPAAESVLPHDIVALPRLFPVMLRVPAIAERVPGTATRIRRAVRGETSCVRCAARSARPDRASQATGYLHRRSAMGGRRWRAVARRVAAAFRCAVLLTLVSFRSEEIARKPFLRKLLEGGDRQTRVCLPLSPMPEAEAGELVDAFLPADSPLSEVQKLRITREAGGSPFVLEQLARYAGATRIEPGRGPTFAEMFDTRLGALSQDARRFVETLAICGRPMAPEIICAACGIANERQSLVAMLRSSQFIRSSGSSERVETYHDRIREVLAAQIDADAAQRIHTRMVQVLVDR